MRLHYVFCFSVFSLALASMPTAQAKCFKYEPEVVTVSGKLLRKTFAGPPNYESIRNGDAPETGFYLSVKQPICTIASQSAGADEAKSGVSLIQLVLKPEAYELLRPLLGQSITVKGSLFSAQTGHHHAPLLLNFVTVEGTPKGSDRPGP